MELRESCRRGLGRIVGAKQVKDTTRKLPTESKTRAHRDSQRLNRELESLYRSDLGSLHICYGCVAWCSYGTPNIGGEGSLTVGCSWDPFPSTGLPQLALISGYVVSLIVTCYATFG